MACLAESTLGICIRTSISWQCKPWSKDLWICFANKHTCIPINTWGLAHHSWFILLSDKNNNIIRRIMLLAHRLSSCKFYSCARYLDMYMYSSCSSKQLFKKCVCAICIYLCIWVCVYLWHIWLVYMYGPALYLFHSGVLLIYIFYMCDKFRLSDLVSK